MNAVERLGSYIFRGVYTVSGPFHPFGGAVDIIVVEQPDGSFKSSPWHIRFGKFQGVLKTREKIVNICVNGTDAGFHMYLDHKGEAYFLREVDGEEDGNVFSPVTSGDEMDEQSQNGRLVGSQIANFDGKQSDMITQIDASNGKIVSRTNSRRSRIFGLMFGRKSVKDDSRLRKGEIDMQRINSLERAEIAADLLEVRWSTNLSTRNGKTTAAAGLSVPEAPCEEAPKDTEVSDKQQIYSPSGHHSMNSSALDVKYSRFQNHQQNLQTAHDAENVHVNELPASEPSVIDLRGPSFGSEASLVGDSSDFRCSSAGKKSNNEDSLLIRDIPDEESQQHGVSTYIYRETSVSFTSGINGSGEGGSLDNLTFGHSGEEVEVYTEVLYDTNELVSNMNSGVDSDAYVVKESLVEFDYSNLGLSRMENLESCEVEDRGITASEKPIERSISFESSSVDSEQMQPKNHCSIDTKLLGLDSVESKTQEVIHQNAASKKFLPVKTSATELTEFLEDQSQLTDTLSATLLSNGAGNERATSTPDFHVGSSKVDQIPDSINNEESEGICISSSLGNLRNQEQETEILGDGIHVLEPLPLSATFVGTREPNNNFLPQEAINTNLLPSDILEDDQCLFSDSNDFAESAIRLGDFTSADFMQTDGQETECSAEEHEPDNVSHLSLPPSGQSLESCSIRTSGSYSGDLTQKLLPNISEDLPMESQTRASPLSIPKSHRSETEGPCSVGSLSNIWNHIHDLESSDACKHLSCSLDSRAISLDWSMLRKDLPCSLKPKLAADSDVAEDHPTANSGAAEIVDTHKMREHEETSHNPAVEISLCGHLLFEGMGADAASRAFDGEKLDFKKFGDQGPSIVKNDKLVVRIGGRYFPWDVAAPIILGMVSFGGEPNFELEGMIAVDEVEKTLQGKLSRTTAPSGGSWRIWPFGLRKSKNELSVHPAPDDTKGNVPGANDNGSDSGRELTEEYKMNKSRTPKKKAASSLFPTPEQLMSLDLKEGQNMITFTFSTAMLGRQQVHARIYVWKWSTHIVISDVDGTITKSDVLGQFMPLVGRDWSQSGVTHLFSAIKENGYQFLFLSARAISQADLTRQFLFNLKQDEKALPDGPVLISPDGLFPSLYREVIRRAPHEFKIACLEGIRSLFPPDCNPFYAGFGNRDTDEFSYLKVGIPKGKIFIINPKGEVAVNRCINTRSYTSLRALVNGMFPATSSSEQEEYNSWNYWRTPLPQIDV